MWVPPDINWVFASARDEARRPLVTGNLGRYLTCDNDASRWRVAGGWVLAATHMDAFTAFDRLTRPQQKAANRRYPLASPLEPHLIGSPHVPCP